jgi:hypothetical protein
MLPGATDSATNEKKMRTSIVSLVLGVVLACPVAAYASETRLGTDPQASNDPSCHARPVQAQITNGLSGNRDACASYGCVGAGGGGD